jgi:DNA-directed RNA polymerase specialized sigma24 family protein
MSDSDPERDFLRFRARHEPAALARVFDATAPKLLLLAAHLARDASSAEDLVQVTFLAALKDADSYDARRPLMQWLAGILAHRASDLRRAKDCARRARSRKPPRSPRMTIRAPPRPSTSSSNA